MNKCYIVEGDKGDIGDYITWIECVSLSKEAAEAKVKELAEFEEKQMEKAKKELPKYYNKETREYDYEAMTEKEWDFYSDYIQFYEKPCYKVKEVDLI